MDEGKPPRRGTRGALVIGALVVLGMAFLGLLYVLTRGRMQAPPEEYRTPPAKAK